MTIEKFAKKIDFRLLRKQKQLLIALLHDDGRLPQAKFSDERQALQGVLVLLDDVMDLSAGTRGKKAVFGNSTNDGCLDHLECPSCGQSKTLKIDAATTATVTDDGTDETADIEWNGLSFATCPDCGYSGRIWQFAV